MKAKTKYCLFVVGIILIIFLYFVISAKSPIELEISGTTCLTSYCLVAQKVAFKKYCQKSHRSASVRQSIPLGMG